MNGYERGHFDGDRAKDKPKLGKYLPQSFALSEAQLQRLTEVLAVSEDGGSPAG